MIEVRPADTIFRAQGGWFTARWHFSFDRYFDPENTSFGDLRVFNDDRLIPGAVWPMHPHRDIEGITYVAEGMFEHADSLGNGGILPPGSMQRATLGSGMEHSERNGSRAEPMRFIQMWIMPAERGLTPSVEQREFDEDGRRDRLRPLLVPAAGFGGEDAPSAPDAVTVHQDAAVHGGLLGAGVSVEHTIRRGFGIYAFVVHGEATLAADGGDPAHIDEGGAAKVRDVERMHVSGGRRGAEILLVETRLARRPM
jgi:redox-sensitive bicupin YhaK (pirin superfamily)